MRRGVGAWRSVPVGGGADTKKEGRRPAGPLCVATPKNLRRHRQVRPLESKRKDLIHRPDDVEGHVVPHVRWDILQISLIPVRYDDLRQACGMRRQYFLLQTANRQDSALERDL